MKEVGVRILGAPIPWKRPGTNGNKFYDRQKLDKLKAQIEIESAIGSLTKFNKVPLELTVDFFFDRANTRKNAQVKYHTSFPDLSNLLKFLEDALSNNFLIPDDRFICRVVMTKQWSNIPRTVFTLKELDNPILTQEQLRLIDLDRKMTNEK